MNHLNTRRVPYAFHTSDMGELGADTEPAPHYTADLPTEPGQLDPEIAVVRYVSGPKSRADQRERVIERKPLRSLELAGNPADEMWTVPPVSTVHRARMPRQQIRQDGRWANALYAAITLVAMAGIGAMLAWRG